MLMKNIRHSFKKLVRENLFTIWGKNVIKRKKTIINYTYNDLLLRRESTRIINQKIQKSYQTHTHNQSIAWPFREQPVTTKQTNKQGKMDSTHTATKIWNTNNATNKETDKIHKITADHVGCLSNLDLGHIPEQDTLYHKDAHSPPGNSLQC